MIQSCLSCLYHTEERIERKERGLIFMNRKNLIDDHHAPEKKLSDFDWFMGMLRGDIPIPVVYDMDSEIRERKRIFEQFVRAFEEAGVYEL